MVERLSPHRPEDVRRQSSRNYENLSQGHAQKRRALYRYEIPPGEIGQREPYSIWDDIASHLDLPNAERVVDLGANDGYFHIVTRNKGFGGRYTGVDIEEDGLRLAEYIARLKHPDSEFVQGDAEDLRGVIEDSSADRVVANFLGYHAGEPERIFSEMHRIAAPGGLGAAASRDVENQLDIWEAARHVARSHGFVFPREVNPETNDYIGGIPTELISVYSHFNIARTRQAISSPKKFRVVHEHIQNSKLWIPLEEGPLDDTEGAIESLLPYTIKLKSNLALGDPGRQPNESDMETMSKFIHTVWRNYIIESALRNQKEMNLPAPYYISHVKQGFFVFEVIRK